MLKATKKYVLLLAIFMFAFIYRLALMLFNGFPSGADIGLHNSVIYSITGSGHVDFLYNFYHIGGGLSLTFPGYHIFASFIMALTGMPEYVAQATIVALFSALVIICAYSITKVVWSESAAIIVAFLVAISRFDIEMLLWAGYPNVITLMLIPVIFYLFLQKDRFTAAPFLVATSILSGAIYMTHSLSAGIFIGVTFLSVLFILIMPKKLGTKRKTGIYWLLPVFIGAVLVSPFLVEAIPVSLTANSSFVNSSSSQAIESALLSTRILPLELVVPLFGVIAAFFVLSKRLKGQTLALPTFFLSLWLFVPLILTQGYLINFPIDYNRFLYFLILPLMIFIAVIMDYGATHFAYVIDTYRTLTSQLSNAKKTVNKHAAWMSARITRKSLYGCFIVAFLLFAFIAVPVFMNPTPELKVGRQIENFYQTMTAPGWNAVQWAKQNTPTDSIFVSDALYGWWFGGFAQRKTLSAVDPQYLSLDREFEPTQFARNLLDTDFLIDNNLTQVREDGGYLARHNPEILASLNWTYFPFSFFNFDSNEVMISYHVNTQFHYEAASNLSVKDMRLETVGGDQRIVVVQGNDYFNYTHYTTVYKGLRFANLTTTLESAVPGVSFDMISVIVQTGGVQIPYDDTVSVGLIQQGVKAFGQLIFNTPLIDKAKVVTVTDSNLVNRVQLNYALDGKPNGEITLSAAAYSVSDSPQWYKDDATMNSYFQVEMTKNMAPNQTRLDTGYRQIFNYQTDMQTYNSSYVACRVPEMYPKFSNDPLFNLVFINKEVAIFKVHR